MELTAIIENTKNPQYLKYTLNISSYARKILLVTEKRISSGFHFWLRSCKQSEDALRTSGW